MLLSNLEALVGTACAYCTSEAGCVGIAVDVADSPMNLDLTTPAGFSAALHNVCRLKPGGMLIIAICCRSFSIMCLEHEA